MPELKTPLSVRPVTADLLPDLGTLFETNGTTRGCYCMWFLVPSKESHAGWGGGNRTAFEEKAHAETRPMGLLAYVDGQPVGWCAVGPRSRYARALRSPVLREHDPAEDDQVWLVPCFFVRVGFRRQGVTRDLLTAAVDLAATHRATAVEGFPLAGEKRRGSGEAFLGVEPLFAACGFTVVDRPTAARVVMRRDLDPSRRTSSRTARTARTGGTTATTRGRRAQGLSEE
jgi:GNAT superfamily N-acetyltransferase